MSVPTTSEMIKYTGFANKKPSSKPIAAPTAAATSRTAKKSSGVRLPGLPARSSLFMRSCRAFCGVERDRKVPSFSIIGRRNRSLNGLDSSTSSMVSGFSPPYTERRCWTICAVFVCGVRARPKKMMKIPMPTANARTGIIGSDLDGDHAPDDEIADEDHEGADRDQDPADEVLEHGPEVCRRHEVHERDQRAGRPRLRGQGCDLALDGNALADGVGDVVEYLCQVATDRAVDRVGSRDQVEVGAGDALGDVLQRLVR